MPDLNRGQDKKVARFIEFTRLILHTWSYTPPLTLTRLLLHAWSYPPYLHSLSYTLDRTHLILHASSYTHTPTLTRLIVHAWSYAPSLTLTRLLLHTYWSRWEKAKDTCSFTCSRGQPKRPRKTQIRLKQSRRIASNFSRQTRCAGNVLLLLHAYAYSYTPTLTRLILHASSYTNFSQQTRFAGNVTIPQA